MVVTWKDGLGLSGPTDRGFVRLSFCLGNRSSLCTLCNFFFLIGIEGPMLTLAKKRIQFPFGHIKAGKILNYGYGRYDVI